MNNKDKMLQGDTWFSNAAQLRMRAAAFANDPIKLRINCIPAWSVLKISLANNSNGIVSLMDSDLAFGRQTEAAEVLSALIINYQQGLRSDMGRVFERFRNGNVPRKKIGIA